MAKQWEEWGASRQHGSPPAYAPGLVDNYFLAYCFHGCNEHVLSPQLRTV